MAEFIAYLIAGIATGAIYALAAIGFTLVWQTSQTINFAQGEFVMIGGMGTVFFLSAGLPLLVAAAAAILVAAAVGYLLQVGAIARAKNASVLSIIIITIGAGMFIRGVAEVILGRNFHSYPSFSGEAPIDIFGARLPSQAFWVFAALFAVSIAIHLFFRHAKLGKAVEAVFSNRRGAETIGINVGRILALCFVIAAAIGAIGGVVMTPITLTHFELGVPLALKGFAAAIVGGLTSPFGAIMGGLILGLIEALAGGYISTTYQEVVVFVIIVGTLLVRPQGLFGTNAVERV